MLDCKKGYFQFSAKDDGLYITIYPSASGSMMVNASDAIFYLDKKNIHTYDSVKINDAFKATKEKPETRKISDEKVNPIREFAVYSMSQDLMRMEAVFYPPFEGAGMLTEDEIIGDITHFGVKNGIQNEEIQSFLKDREYCKAYNVAYGTKAEQGKDGFIEYKFNTELKPVPKMNEDGSVDFHTLENVNHVKKGDVVAILHPETRGIDGLDLLGRKIIPDKVKHIVFRYGRNLSVSEDGSQLISDVSGHVTLENDKIFVSNVLEVVNVDNSTGNISYEGNVAISGNVLAGFSVRATGDISVSGIVEGAEITAGGNITFNRGVQGMNRAVIKAGGNIISKFIESVELVEAKGNLETDSILHSKLNIRGSIKASGKNGLIIGGEVKSSSLITAKTVGNQLGTATIIGVGVDPAAKKKMEDIKKQLQDLGNNKIKLNQIVTVLRKKQELEGSLSEDKKAMLQKTMKSMLLIDKELAELKKEFEDLRQMVSEDKDARIKVSGTAYPGTKLVFGDQFLFLKDKYDHCQFMKENSEIKSTLL